MLTGGSCWFNPELRHEWWPYSLNIARRRYVSKNFVHLVFRISQDFVTSLN